MGSLVNRIPRIINIRINSGCRAASISNRLITGVRKHLTITNIMLPRLPSYWHPRNFISLFPRRGNSERKKKKRKEKKRKKNETKPAKFGNTGFFFVCISSSLVFSFCHLSVVACRCTTLQIVKKSIDERAGKIRRYTMFYVFRSLFVDDSPPFWILSQRPLKYRSILIDSPSLEGTRRVCISLRSWS